MKGSSGRLGALRRGLIEDIIVWLCASNRPETKVEDRRFDAWEKYKAHVVGFIGPAHMSFAENDQATKGF